MLKRVSYAAVFIVVLLLNLPGYAHSADSNSHKNFLWQVQSKTTTAYILGSIHFMQQKSYPLNNAIEDAFQKAEILVVEADINTINPNDLSSFMQKAMYTGSDSLGKHISKETYGLVLKEINRLGLPPDFLLKQKPWLLSMTLQVLELMRMGFDPNYGIDQHFLTKAAGRKKIMEIESVESQLALLSGFSESEQEALLAHTIKYNAVLEKKLALLIPAWTSGDTKTVEALLSEGLDNDPKLALINDKLINKRNREMAAKIEGMLKTKDSSFIVIGAGHLVGEYGVIRILEKKGYTVKQQ